MSNVWFFTLTSVIIISLISLVGVFTLSLKIEKLKKIVFLLVSFATGALLGGAFIHLIPEAFESTPGIKVSIYVLVGIGLFFILEKLIHWRHCHIPTSKKHPHPVGYMNLIGDAFHNFVDGMIVAGSYLVSIPLGLATTIAVILHEIPQEIGDFGILIHAGFSRAKALFANFLSALTAILGAIIVLIIGAKIGNITSFLIPFTAGGFIYIASSDLIPELQKESKLSKSLLQLLGIVLGVLVMLVLVFME